MGLEDWGLAIIVTAGIIMLLVMRAAAGIAKPRD
jgi:hypothetical protein